MERKKASDFPQELLKIYSTGTCMAKFIGESFSTAHKNLPSEA